MQCSDFGGCLTGGLTGLAAQGQMGSGRGALAMWAICAQVYQVKLQAVQARFGVQHFVDPLVDQLLVAHWMVSSGMLNGQFSQS
jgi:hypothetical protein